MLILKIDFDFFKFEMASFEWEEIIKCTTCKRIIYDYDIIHRCFNCHELICTGCELDKCEMDLAYCRHIWPPYCWECFKPYSPRINEKIKKEEELDVSFKQILSKFKIESINNINNGIFIYKVCNMTYKHNHYVNVLLIKEGTTTNVFKKCLNPNFLPNDNEQLFKNEMLSLVKSLQENYSKYDIYVDGIVSNTKKFFDYSKCCE